MAYSDDEGEVYLLVLPQPKLHSARPGNHPLDYGTKFWRASQAWHNNTAI